MNNINTSNRDKTCLFKRIVVDELVINDYVEGDVILRGDLDVVGDYRIVGSVVKQITAADILDEIAKLREKYKRLARIVFGLTVLVGIALGSLAVIVFGG